MQVREIRPGAPPRPRRRRLNPAVIPAGAAGYPRLQGTGATSGPTASLAATFASSVVVGSLVVVSIGAWSNPAVSSFTVTDNKGNTYAQAVLFSASGLRRSAIWYTIVATGGSGFQVTVTPNVSSYLAFEIAEHSVTGNPPVLDTTGTGTGSSATPSAGNLTLTSTGELVAMTTVADIGMSPTAGSGFTLGYASNLNEPIANQYNPSATGTVTTDLPLASSTMWSATAAAFKSGSTVGGSATLSAATGVFGFSGNSANLLAGRVLGAATGAYGLTGQAAGLLSGRVLPASTGAFALTGNAANLVYFRPGTYVLVAEPGSFSLTGNAAGLLAGRVLVAAPGSFALSSVGASLTWSGHITPSFIDPDEVTMITP